MTPENFVYWLNGFLEISGDGTLDARQTQIIREHIALVLKKTTHTVDQAHLDRLCGVSGVTGKKNPEIFC